MKDILIWLASVFCIASLTFHINLYNLSTKTNKTIMEFKRMNQQQIDLIAEVDLLIRKEVNQLLFDMDKLNTLQCFDTNTKLTNAFYHFVTEYNKLIKYPGRSPRVRNTKEG